MDKFLEKYEKMMAEKRIELKNRLGNKCFVCGRLEGLTKFKIRRLSLSFHEIHGKQHPNSNKPEGLDYIESNIDNFVLLCSHCHGKVHHYKNMARKDLVHEKVRYLASFL
jgi:hypothetical protein